MPGTGPALLEAGRYFRDKLPALRQAVEFWKDDPKLKCPSCKKQIINPKLDLSCAQWCKYAKQCLGTLAGSDGNVLCGVLLEEMKKICKDEPLLIDDTVKQLKLAEQIQSGKGGDPLVVKAAVILNGIIVSVSHNIQKTDIAEPRKAEVPAIAKAILIKYGVSAEQIEHILKIILALQNAESIDSIEFGIVKEAADN